MEREMEVESDNVEIDDTDEIIKEAQELENDKNKEPESYDESVREALKEVEEQGVRDQGEKEEEQKIPDVDETKKEEQKTEQVKTDPTDYDPPSRLSPQEKKIFNKLPKEFKPAVARMFKDYEVDHRNKQNSLAEERREATREKQEAVHVLQAIRPYYVSMPDFAKSGITEGHLVSALVAAHQKLTHKDLNIRLQEYIELGKQVGVDVSPLLEQVPAERQNVDISQHPAFRDLQEKQNLLISTLEEQKINAAASPVIRAFESVKEEKDPRTGNFLYPQLQNDNFWGYAKPLIIEKINAGATPQDALKSVYVQTFGAVQLNSSSQVSLPSNNQNNNSRAVSAAVSVRGKTVPSIPSRKNNGDVPRDETFEQSILAALEETRRGL